MDMCCRGRERETDTGQRRRLQFAVQLFGKFCVVCFTVARHFRNCRNAIWQIVLVGGEGRRDFPHRLKIESDFLPLSTSNPIPWLPTDVIHAVLLLHRDLVVGEIGLNSFVRAVCLYCQS